MSIQFQLNINKMSRWTEISKRPWKNENGPLEHTLGCIYIRMYKYIVCIIYSQSQNVCKEKDTCITWLQLCRQRCACKPLQVSPRSWKFSLKKSGDAHTSQHYLGKLGWLIESGNFWVSRQNPPCFLYIAPPFPRKLSKLHRNHHCNVIIIMITSHQLGQSCQCRTGSQAGWWSTQASGPLAGASPLSYYDEHYADENWGFDGTWGWQ